MRDACWWSVVIGWRDEGDAASLKAACRAETRRDIRPRLHAVWLLRRGERLWAVARVPGVHEPPCSGGWLVPGGWPDGGDGTPPPGADHRRPAQRGSAHGGDGPGGDGAFRTAVEAGQQITAQYGATYRPGGSYDRLGRLGVHPKVPRSVNPAVGLAERGRWRKGGLSTAPTDAGVSAPRVIGFRDEMRLRLIGTVRRMWAPPGCKVVSSVQYVRRWCSLVLAVDPQAGRLWWYWKPDMNAAPIVQSVAAWHTADIEVIIWGRAPDHWPAIVHARDVTLIAQPPHSPELNQAERVVEAIRQSVEGEVSPTLEPEYAAVHAHLQAPDADPDRTRSLVGWDWIAA